eukprot:TRINITY_DN8253_c0_g1_i1.p1 TRINITY_DN8253_c0_g1~~TRINITY_DN8253_c0_g1_i1.p1  ORF type:complete len:189 (+),score=29.41 TRINITY_DN8253_c0_g1_i1:226-792(+)
MAPLPLAILPHAMQVNTQIPALFAPEGITLQLVDSKSLWPWVTDLAVRTWAEADDGGVFRGTQCDANGVERDVFVVVTAKSGPATLTSMHTAEELAAQCDRCATGKLRHFMEDFVDVKLFIKTRAVEQVVARYADLSGQPRATVISVLAAQQLSEHDADLALQKSRLFRLVLSTPGGTGLTLRPVVAQ